MESEVKKKCVIIGASPECDGQVLTESVSKDDFVVCADGGYRYALQAGIKPDLIIGDFDSSDFPENTDCQVISLPTHKDDTDTMYCVRECLKMGYTKFVFLAVTGGRCDHTYANYCTLLHLAEKNIRAKIIDTDNEIFIVTSGTRVIENRQEHTFSIFPFGCEKCTVTLKGFEYGLDKGTLTVDFPLGVSNVVQSSHAEITVYEGNALCILQR